jgi:tripartite-type tricarboxylate transporter receptor subunit TctC
MNRVLFASLAVMGSVVCGTVSAVEFPDRPITLIVPYSAGGPADAIARPLALHMSKTLGQQIIIENVTGAGGTLGTQRLTRSAADGYTLLIHNLGLAAAPQFFRNLGYDTEASLAPIGLINSGPMVLVGRKSFGADNAEQLWRVIKKEGNNISMAHAGLGANSHLCGILLNRALGIDVTFVPYKGTGPAMNDLLGEQVDLVCDQSTTAVPQIVGGKVKAFVVTADERVSAIPNVPTSQEVQLPAFTIGIWHGLYAPAGTPPEIVLRLNRALQEALDDPTMIERFKQAGTKSFPTSARSPESHHRKFKEEIERWSKLIGNAHLN